MNVGTDVTLKVPPAEIIFDYRSKNELVISKKKCRGWEAPSPRGAKVLKVRKDPLQLRGGFHLRECKSTK